MIGIDEVGRGAWAGPLLVVAARQNSELPHAVRDSKLTTRKQREVLITDIKVSCDLGEGWVSAEEIDALGLTAAMQLAVSRALDAIQAIADEAIIMDGHINYCDAGFVNAQAVVDADATYPIVSAASVYAKVVRDNHMADLATQFPGYGFEKHVGYGTRQHKEAIAQLGITPQHRKSYKPIRTFL